MTKKKDTKQLAYACSDTIGYLRVMFLSKPKLDKSKKVQSKARSSYNDAYALVSWATSKRLKFTFIEKYVDTKLGFTA
ncbi:hypothetical protein D8674_011304 [Pyrus ussuriensis x Pyrus communis]|uniref:Uncharacterized protein n=1 Tax=Pyrus ussuriensis x Pyrus communis TaxID=2448454 RepID=A0A5N5FYG1_9ROSA|nr:hypothetical protein D8674_011304 [Pyrus ussuriensis x Pyrus communis]